METLTVFQLFGKWVFQKVSSPVTIYKLGKPSTSKHTHTSLAVYNWSEEGMSPRCSCIKQSRTNHNKTTNKKNMWQTTCAAASFSRAAFPDCATNKWCPRKHPTTLYISSGVDWRNKNDKTVRNTWYKHSFQTHVNSIGLTMWR